MNAIRNLWLAVSSLTAGINRLASLTHAAADTLQERLELMPEQPVLENGAEPKAKKGARA